MSNLTPGVGVQVAAGAHVKLTIDRKVTQTVDETALRAWRDLVASKLSSEQCSELAGLCTDDAQIGTFVAHAFGLLFADGQTNYFERPGGPWPFSAQTEMQRQIVAALAALPIEERCLRGAVTVTGTDPVVSSSPNIFVNASVLTLDNGNSVFISDTENLRAGDLLPDGTVNFSLAWVERGSLAIGACTP